MKAIIAATMLLLFAGMAGAQTVGPTAMEFRGPKAHGTVMVHNNGVNPLHVTVGPQGFTWQDGNPQIADFPAGISFDTKQKELTLGPQQTKYVDFNVRCEALPCHLYVTPVFTTGIATNGLTVALHMPVAVYLCSAKKACRHDTLLAAGAIKQ